MTTTLEHEQNLERSSSRPEQHEKLPRIAKSREFFTGDLNDGVSFSFNDAVIAAQKEMGPTLYLTPDSFGDIMPSDWATMRVGQALDAFDRAYETWAWQQLGYSEETITEARDAEAKPDTHTIETGEQISEAMTAFDERFANDPTAPPRQEYEAFVWRSFMDAHPELDTPSTDPYNPGAVEIRNPPETNASAEEAAAKEAFDTLLTEHPELDSLRDEYESDLAAYLEQKYSTPS
jgi:hypothetical protein